MKAAPENLDVSDLSRSLPAGVTLIEASAGTGKTHTVTALFLRLLLEQDLEIDQILVTTFTIAATAELRARIRSLLHDARDALSVGASNNQFLAALVEHFQTNVEAVRERLTRAIYAFDEAAIHTMHGFCQRVLRDRAFESGAPFEQEFVTDESRLLLEIAQDYWRRRFYDCEPFVAATALAQELSPDSFARLLKLRLNHPLAVVVPEMTRQALHDLEGALRDRVAQLRECWKRDRAEIHSIFLSDNKWALAAYKAELMKEHLAAVASCLENSGLPRFASLAIFARSAIEAKVRSKHPAPCHDFFDQCEELKSLTEKYAQALEQDFLAWAANELEQRKLRLNVQSASDLLIRLHDGLFAPSGPALAEAIRRRFKVALIDEFQDTDPLQERIFHRIFGHEDCRLFLIGDPKQAIYGFRGADIFTYLQASKHAHQRYTLGTNYRSTTKLVEAANHFFGRSARPFVLQGIDYHPMRAAGGADSDAFSGDSNSSPLRIWVWESDEKLNAAEIDSEIVATVAAEIARILDSTSSACRIGARRVIPSDIAVLTRTNDEAQQMQAALAALGVPGVLLSNKRVYTSHEATELLTVLSAIAKPRHEAALRAALFTDMFGVSAVELDALSSDENAWEARLLQFAGWHDLWISHGFIQMFRRFLLEAGIRARVLTRSDGQRRLTNLLHLSELLQQATIDFRLEPTGLVKWFAEQMADPREASDEDEIRLERDENAVHILTVHKSKGLQFNIVFCPFLWKTDNDKKRFYFHDPAHANRLTLDLRPMKESENGEGARLERLAEQTRLVYVALTRARARCDIVWGKFKNGERPALAWLLHPPPPPQAASATAFAEYVKGLQPEGIRADLETLARGSNETITVLDLPSQETAHYRASTPASNEQSRARELHATIERDWNVSSFSSLTERRDAEIPDHDSGTPEPPEIEDIEPVGIHAFPPGTRAGLCLHSILQRLDFTELSKLDSIVGKALTDFAFDSDWKPVVAECLQNTLKIKLTSGFALEDIPSSACLTELEFYLPARRLEAEPLRAILQADERPRLDFAPRRGWLKGYIDLVFEHGGRFYIVDWKSNRLGSHTGAYTQEALASAMAAHHYNLQLHLYTVALHRYLRWRIPGYDYDRAFGGVFYFFLRGMDPDHPERG
ncbi:MAG TPA: exodeoxyribonuclease V subunit beta, partial [Chthoniobacteraceae bacterium]